MVALVQRVKSSSVEVEGEIVGEINRGLCVLLGVEKGDTREEAQWLAKKVATLRVFPDDEGKMNRSLLDIEGEALVVSQFTLLGNLKKGTRPSFTRAAGPDAADALYQFFIAGLESHLDKPVASGTFGATMQVNIENDGPVTLWLERRPKA